MLDQEPVQVEKEEIIEEEDFEPPKYEETLWSILISFFILAVVLFIFPLIYCTIENSHQMKDIEARNVTWSYTTCVYVCTEIYTTIGFGDFKPRTTPGRVFLILYSIICLISFAFVISLLGHPAFHFCNEKLESFYKLFNHKAAPNLKRVTLFIILIGYWLLGGLIFSFMEGWDYFTGVYFAYLTLSTIGLGDVVVTKTSSRMFLVFYALIGIGMDTLVISSLVSFVTKKTIKSITSDKKGSTFTRKENSLPKPEE